MEVVINPKTAKALGFDVPANLSAVRQWSIRSARSNAGWDGRTFLTKRLPKVATEMALNVLAYSMKRVMAIIGVAGIQSSGPSNCPGARNEHAGQSGLKRKAAI